MELEGSLKAFSLPEVLQFLSMGKMSGYLHLNRGSVSIALTIKGGRIVNSSTLTRARRLGEMLIQRGVLRRRDLEEVLSLQKTIESDRRLGELLVERDLITEKSLRETIRLQLEEEVWDLFSWDDGHFKFEHGQEQDITSVAVMIDIEPLLLEGSRRQDEWAKIRHSIPDDTVVFTLVPLPADFRRTIKLSPNEWKVLSTINGVLSVEAVVNRCSLGRFQTCHILNSFLSDNLIRIVPAPMGAANTAPRDIRPSAEALRRATALIAAVPQVEATKSRLGGFFGSKPKSTGDRPEGDVQPVNYIAPVSLVAATATAFCQQAYQQKDFMPKPEESRLLETLWRDVLMAHPRADLIRVIDNVIDPLLLESYIEKTENAPVVQECQEEAIEAMIKVLDIVYRIAAQRLGEKATQKLLQGLIETAGPRAVFRYGSPFDLAIRCFRTISVAA